jgi:glycosyltransferase involved in cell wall biosynthesis
MTKRRNPLVSVIIPVYNREAYLAQAIESVLAQNYQSLDIVVIDDGSTDASGKVAQTYASHIRYQFQANAGIGGALKKGVELAVGDFLSFLDSDDFWVEDKLSQQMDFLIKHPDTDAVFSQIEQFYSQDITPAVRDKYRFAQNIINAYCADTILIRRESFFRVGNFKADFKSGAFMEWFTRAKDIGLNFQIIPAILAKRRIHNTNFGIQNRATQYQDYTRILKAALDRHRSKQRVSRETDNENAENNNS